MADAEHTDNHLCFRTVTDAEAREALGRDYERHIEEGRKRESRLQEFEAELNRDGGLSEKFTANPTELLRDRELLNPHDQVGIELEVPGIPELPGLDLPIRVIRCWWVCYHYWVWRYVVIGGRRFYYRVLVYRCRRICIYGF